jgi:WXG100 family type VII secretion target
MPLEEPLFPLTIERRIQPQGAHQDAATFRAVADRFRTMAESLRRELGRLNQGWQGHARDRFFESVNPLPNQMEAYAETLENMALMIEQKKVTIQETIWVTRDQIS